jgi:hypothetical protein
LRLLMVSTTGEHAAWFELDDQLVPRSAPMPQAVAGTVARIGENCEPSLCTVLFMAGAGGSLRAGVTENPVLLTRSVAAGETRVTMGGAPVFLWPGGGITVMVDVLRLPKDAFGSVPTPAIVAPIEFTLPRAVRAAGRAHGGRRRHGQHPARGRARRARRSVGRGESLAHGEGAAVSASGREAEAARSRGGAVAP